MTDYQKYINALRKCAKEHENDKRFTGNIIVSDLCRDTANLFEKLEQEPILDKIRAEIEQLPTNLIDVQRPHSVVGREVVELGSVIRILDKYKGESEPQESDEIKYYVEGIWIHPHKDSIGEYVEGLSYDDAMKLYEEWQKDKIHKNVVYGKSELPF